MGKKKNRLKSAGFKPFESAGSLSYIGKETSEKTEIVLTNYNSTEISQISIDDTNEISSHLTDTKLSWLDVDGVHQPALIEQLGNIYGLHPLMLEDVLNTTQKPKMEYFEDGNQLFVVMKMLNLDEENLEIETEQISLVLGKNYVISFQEKDRTDVFENIHNRINQTTSRIRKYNSDYLVYAMIDLVVDHHYVLLEKITSKLEDLEALVLHNPAPELLNKIYIIKKEMTFMRKSILPLKDIIGALIREESDLVGHQVDVYLRDVQDHVIQNIDTLDTFRDVADNIMANYHAAISNRMNSVMKTLTVFTVIFMPLSFLAGVYGMNFVNMPELKSENGYYITLAGMAMISVGLWFYFKWKKYL